MTRWMALWMVGCVVHTQDESAPHTRPLGDPPTITYAEAEFRPNYGDSYWRLDAEVEEGDDPVEAVIMDVFDEGCGGCRVESIELFERWSGFFQHEWHGSLQVLDPGYDGYVIEVYAIDTVGRIDMKEIWPH